MVHNQQCKVFMSASTVFKTAKKCEIFKQVEMVQRNKDVPVRFPTVL